MTETEFTKAYKALKRIDDTFLSAILEDSRGFQPGKPAIKMEFETNGNGRTAYMKGIEIGEFFSEEFKIIYNALEKLKRLEFDEMVDNSLRSGISEESPYDFLEKLRGQIPSRHPMSAEADRITEEEIFDELEKKSDDLWNVYDDLSSRIEFDDDWEDNSIDKNYVLFHLKQSKKAINNAIQTLQDYRY